MQVDFKFKEMLSANAVLTYTEAFMVICHIDPTAEEALGLQLFCITDNEKFPWPWQSLVVLNWSMRDPLWPLSGVGLCIMALHLEERSGLLHEGLDEDVTRLYCLVCYCQATIVAHFLHKFPSGEKQPLMSDMPWFGDVWGIRQRLRRRYNMYLYLLR